ncbi:MAG: DUF368 domain-containing protein [Clostridia bacterium]|nr:DUF368 domain-containing protein [Clostridia bacterium]
MDLTYKNFKEVLISLLAGAFIGISVIVPGLSGSALAMILKVYDKIMYAFSNIFRKFKSCFIFLLPIVGGIAVGFLAGLVLVKFLIERYPFITMCLFVGLMIGTIPMLFSEVKGEKSSPSRITLLVVGAIIPLAITIVSMFVGGNNSLENLEPWHYAIFAGIGVLVSLTQLIPGLSATVLLMIFGYYSPLITGVEDVFSNTSLLLVYGSLAVGFVIGVLLFSKLISVVLEKAKVAFYYLVCGLSSSSALAVFLGSDCLEIYKYWPNGNTTRDIVLGIVMLALGFGITFFFYIENKKRN